ncbi:LAXTG-anchored chaplin ChpA [Streptomyces thermocarboxydovorans]|uniref:LAXTG-anchored chaplin ChpA n=1 Tax=Streptomyces thermocarboxydovorans TaxID=59298 RepID=A0ABN1HKS1_9ACTN
MRQTLSRGVFAAAAATGILSLYGAPAIADSQAEGAAENSPGVLSGNNVQVPVEAPVNVCGNTVGAVGALNEAAGNVCANSSDDKKKSAAADSSSTSASGAASTRSATKSGSGGGAQAEGIAKGSPGVGSGNNVQVPVEAPVNVCGNNIAGAGLFNETAGNTCVNHSHSHKGGPQAVGSAEGSPGVLSGNLIQLPVHAPVNACGNNLDVVGIFNSAYENYCENSVSTPDEPEKETKTPPSTKKPPTTDIVAPPAEEKEPEAPSLAETGSDGILTASAAGTALLIGGALLYRRGRAASRV